MCSTHLEIVVPCFNEEKVVLETSFQLKRLLRSMISDGLISTHSRICFVDDGSTDRTWTLIRTLTTDDAAFRGIKLSRNRGHQNALLAGLENSRADIVITIDADLQDDVSVIPQMVSAFHTGADIVYGIRSLRTSDTFLKRQTAQVFYRLMSVLGVQTVNNHADFRLMSRRALDALLQYRERNLYLRGIVPLLGYPTASVTYERKARFAGETKYPMAKMLALATDAVTSFSTAPLKIITALGVVVFAGSILASLAVIWIRFWLHTMPMGWASTLLPLFLLGGLQIFCIGVLGIYLGRIYLEVKDRPRFVVEDVASQARSATEEKEIQE